MRAHPIEGTWSALEYACHVRDVMLIQRERLQRALVEEGYNPTPMGRDARVVEHHYNEQDPAAVADELATAADALAADVEAFTPSDFERTMIYNFPSASSDRSRWSSPRCTKGSTSAHVGLYTRRRGSSPCPASSLLAGTRRRGAPPLLSRRFRELLTSVALRASRTPSITPTFSPRWPCSARRWAGARE